MDKQQERREEGGKEKKGVRLLSYVVAVVVNLFAFQCRDVCLLNPLGRFLTSYSVHAIEDSKVDCHATLLVVTHT